MFYFGNQVIKTTLILFFAWMQTRVCQITKFSRGSRNFRKTFWTTLLKIEILENSLSNFSAIESSTGLKKLILPAQNEKTPICNLLHLRCGQNFFGCGFLARTQNSWYFVYFDSLASNFSAFSNAKSKKNLNFPWINNETRLLHIIYFVCR